MLHVQFVNGIHGNVLNCLGRKYSCMNLSDYNAAVLDTQLNSQEIFILTTK